MGEVFIETPKEYVQKEARLLEIKSRLENIVKKENTDLIEVVTLRNEARDLANSLKVYLKKTFELKS